MSAAESNIHPLPIAPAPSAFLRPAVLLHGGRTVTFANTTDLYVALRDIDRAADAQWDEVEHALLTKAWEHASPAAHVHVLLATNPGAMFLTALLIGFMCLAVR